MVFNKALLCAGLVCLAISVASASYVDNSGDVTATQSQSQSSANTAYYNSGPVNQQSSNQAVQQAGNGNYASNDNDQTIEGRRLLGYYIDNHGDVVATQSQSQSSENDAYGNSGPVNQQSNNQAIQQAGNGNYASNSNAQTIKGGRKLLGYYIDNHGDVHATQSQSQTSSNTAVGNSGPVNQQSNNQAIQQAGNGNSAANDNDQTIEGRRLLGLYIDNHGNVWATQSQSQSSTNDAEYNSGPVNQQSNNQAIQQAGNGNSATNDNDQTIEGRRLLGYYYIDNHGDVHATQSQSQSSSNTAIGNSGPVNQQSNNQAIQQAGNGNSAENDNDQTIGGRRLLGYYYIDNSGNVHATQSQSQSSTNDAEYNSGPVNQQSNNQAIQQAGNGNSATNDNDQTIEGRRLLGYYIDNHGDVVATQSQSQSSSNYAYGNSGPVNQQSNNQAIQQAGNGNYASNSNTQTIKP